MTRASAFAALLLCVCAVPARPAAAQPSRPASLPCQQSLWGCAPRASEVEGMGASGPAQRYERLIASARGTAGPLRAGMSTDLDGAARTLTEATQLLPDSPEAYSLLGQVHLERGQLEAAAAALRRAEELFAGSDAASFGPIERIDPPLALALGLVLALEGDLSGALERYLRLLRLSAANHRLLYRTADVLMALGRLDEATTLFERACMLPRGSDTPSIDIPRACHGYLVALDRGERRRSAQAQRRTRGLDRDQHALRYLDFLTPWEREYHLALVLPPTCDRRDAFLRYLRGAQASAAAAGRYAPPPSYLRRAEVHLKELAGLSCP